MQYTENDFVVILEEQCQPYHITASIHGLVYRIEVSNDGKLEDAIEVSCSELKTSPESEQQFRALYTEAHQTYIEKFCSKMQPEESHDNLSDSIEKLESAHLPQNRFKHSYEKTKSYLKSKRKNSRIFLAVAMIVTTVLALFLGYVSMCSERFMGIFLNNDRKMAYFKQVEPFCHKLENRCKNLTKINPDQTEPQSIQACRDWCGEGIISPDQCALFLAYFPSLKQEEESTEPIPQEKSTQEQNSTQEKIKFLIEPQGKINLLADQYTEIVVKNYTETTFEIKLEKIHIENTPHEEIVQFRKGIVSLSVDNKREKVFKVFLEPTYYQQFEKALYTGVFSFRLSFEDGESREVKKPFSFRVE